MSWCKDGPRLVICQETEGDTVARDLEPGGVFSHKLLQGTQAIVTPQDDMTRHGLDDMTNGVEPAVELGIEWALTMPSTSNNLEFEQPKLGKVWKQRIISGTIYNG